MFNALIEIKNKMVKLIGVEMKETLICKTFKFKLLL